jgi:hypothetical protein
MAGWNSKPYTPPVVWECLRKHRHTRERALKVVAELKKRQPVARAYPCPHCGGWHVTSKPKHGRSA